MKNTISVDTQGRIVLPKKYRQKHNITDLSKLTIELQGDSIILTPTDKIGFNPTQVVSQIALHNNDLLNLNRDRDKHLNLIVDLQTTLIDQQQQIDKLSKGEL